MIFNRRFVLKPSLSGAPFGLLGGGVTMGPEMMGWGGFGFNPLWRIVMLIFWVLIIAGVVVLVAWLVQQGRPSETGPALGGRVLEILQERHAKGEITKEQFEQMRQDLKPK